MKTIVELNTENFDQTIATAKAPVLVDFYAPWCGPCKMLAPLLDQLATQFADRVKFAKVNVDEGPELGARFEITGVPTLLFFRGGKACDSIVGMPSPRALVARIEAMLAAERTEGCSC